MLSVVEAFIFVLSLVALAKAGPTRQDVGLVHSEYVFRRNDTHRRDQG